MRLAGSRWRPVAALAAALLATPLALADAEPTTERISVDSAELEHPGDSFQEQLAESTKAVAFSSTAQLTPGDTDTTSDVYVRSRIYGTTVEASVFGDGADGTAASSNPSIDYFGTRVAFESRERFAPADSESNPDIYVHDFDSGTTVLASVRSDGANTGNGNRAPAISTFGRFVAFESAGHLVPRDRGSDLDVFVRDLDNGRTSRVSVRSDGSEVNDQPNSPYQDPTSIHPAISADGNLVSFTSLGRFTPGDSQGADVFVHNRRTGRTTRVTDDRGGADNTYSSISGDGRFVAFVSRGHYTTGDIGKDRDIFVRDRKTGSVDRVTVRSDGTEANGDLQLLGAPEISEHGRFVAFESKARYAPSDTDDLFDVFVHDRRTGKTRIVSVRPDGSQITDADAHAFRPSMARDGQLVGFDTTAPLVPPDAGADDDVFVRGPLY
jgi:hypothetical protein